MSHGCHFCPITYERECSICNSLLKCTFRSWGYGSVDMSIFYVRMRTSVWVSQYPRETPGMDACACNCSPSWWGDKRNSGTCWPLDYLQVQWETMSQENNIESDRAGHLVSFSGLSIMHGCAHSHMCGYATHTHIHHTPKGIHLFLLLCCMWLVAMQRVKKYSSISSVWPISRQVKLSWL